MVFCTTTKSHMIELSKLLGMEAVMRARLGIVLVATVLLQGGCGGSEDLAGGDASGDLDAGVLVGDGAADAVASGDSGPVIDPCNGVTCS